MYCKTQACIYGYATNDIDSRSTFQNKKGTRPLLMPHIFLWRIFVKRFVNGVDIFPMQGMNAMQ